jgi:gibberellin 2-oxidase
MVDSVPPFLQRYVELLQSPTPEIPNVTLECTLDECSDDQLPLIDLGDLNSCDESTRVACAAAICRASSEWGFFQVVNHGISGELLVNMKREQVKLFETPFERKVNCGLLNNSYRWGSPAATSSKQLSWSEAFHISLSKISQDSCYGEGFISLREVMQEFAAAMSRLSMLLIRILAENLGHEQGEFDIICDKSTCFLRLNRYPACPISPEMFGLVPHTDSDFLTILYQDQVGGLQLQKDSRWVSVKPNQDALIVNIGDLLQAWSNDEYKSVEHKVMANGKMERYSIAYFLCPSYDSVIGSCSEPSIYREFTFGEYRSQVQEDVKKIGHKVGLPRFLLHNPINERCGIPVHEQERSTLRYTV